MRTIAGFIALGLLLATPLEAAEPPARPAPPTPAAIAPGVWIIPGAMLPDRQPDGNTVIFDAPAGLVVMDTGRHPWHRQAILDFARTQHRDIVAIVNSHWHLDHVSGNPDLKRAYPGARVYASGAIDGALTGFLKDSAADGRKYLGSDKLPAATLEDLRADLATTENGEALKPDVRITASRTLTLGGRRLRVNLALNAATDGDVWIYDPKTRTAAVGDLVTLPAPFLDTACPEGWRAALAQVWATPFTTVIPGHGAPMTRPQFAAYRAAYGAFIDCSNSARPALECATDWSQAMLPFFGGVDLDRRRAKGMAAYYVTDVLRAHQGRSASCEAR